MAKVATASATGIGFIAIFLWALLASLTTFTHAIPPFQLVAMSFAVGSLLGFIYLLATGKTHILWSLPVKAYILGVSGLFLYHFFYFLALKRAPPLEANLINYLWPLLIVLFSTLLPQHHMRGMVGGLKWWHIAGAVMGLFGTILVLISSADSETSASYWLGYSAALAAALIWSGYSVLSRLLPDIPSSAVAAFCLITAAGATLCHLIFEETVWPDKFNQWTAICALGLGPVGSAFYFWDYGIKHGDLRILGAGAYLTPLLSTLLLVVLGLSTANPMLWLACFLTTGGAVLAAKDMIVSPKTNNQKG